MWANAPAYGRKRIGFRQQLPGMLIGLLEAATESLALPEGDQYPADVIAVRARIHAGCCFRNPAGAFIGGGFGAAAGHAGLGEFLFFL